MSVPWLVHAAREQYLAAGVSLSAHYLLPRSPNASLPSTFLARSYSPLSPSCYCAGQQPVRPPGAGVRRRDQEVCVRPRLHRVLDGQGRCERPVHPPGLLLAQGRLCRDTAAGNPTIYAVDPESGSNHGEVRVGCADVQEQSGDTSDISWNFAKFLVRPDGTVAGRYPPHTSPNALRPFIEQILGDANTVEL